ncbi:hypothetical protein G6F70_004707 [Rhizopus microsporus]|uniref:Uncharacterized protein n=2 Tax=Rhizopus TaxID=4842 RepID=A0A1X0SAM5_RHIZD|nr:hypothetical protein G6F71_004739 [Rhizopus microsporus]KAG1199688.1 hypothetical protein G6F70_004707 [Rhizopus microsporus]KAG1211430.1 hypothetical protein G6F69_004604 [Rhizopus microsporus]ORE21218.1 hypothetical protein BCV71DRAFT_277265 [Rhizopus microsporus]
MTAYTLLEQPLSRRISKRQCQIVALLFTSLLFLLFFFFKTTQEETLPYDKTYPPIRYINFTVPGQDDLVYVDLDRYPIEDQIIQLFAGSKEVIQEYTINKIQKKKQSPWVKTPSRIQPDTYACKNQLPPYPILRRIVKDHLDIADTNVFFEDDVELNLSLPFVFLPFEKQPKLKKGYHVCIRALVPFRDQGTHDPYNLFYRPYPTNHEQISYPWWDTMMTTLRNTQTDEITSLTMNPWLGHKQLRMKSRELRQVNSELPEWSKLRNELLRERKRLHMYEADFIIPADDAEYELSSLLEFVEGRYNFDYGPVTTYEPLQMPVLPFSKITTGKVQLKKKETLAEKLLKEHLKLPLCNGSDHPGRWLPWPNHTEYSTSQVLALTRHGKYWAPYSCRYRHLSYEQFNRCVSQKYPHGLDLYGDSNMRRAIKKFVSHGQWCKDWHKHITDPIVPEEKLPTILHKRQEEPKGYSSPQEYRFIVPEQTRSCYCEDFFEPYWNLDWFSGGARRFYLEINNSPAQVRAVGKTEWDKPEIRRANPGDKFKINSYKWDGLTYFNEPSWETAVRDNREISDVAVFSLGNWDSAFSNLESYLKDVDVLIQQIKDHYDLNKTMIIYRTPQYYCCRIDRDRRQRQVSGPKLDVFDIEVRKKFQEELHAIIWDTKILGETRTWEEKLESVDCSSNHVAADLVEVENQIFMNALCNK